MANRLIVFCCVMTTLAVSITPAFSAAKKTKLLSAQTKVSMKRAEKIALGKVTGQTEEIELERNKDGKLVYTVEIKQESGKELDVEIDALSGKILKAEEDNDDKNTGEQSEMK